MFSILVIDGFYQYFFGINLTGYSLGHEKRVSSFFYDEFILRVIWPGYLQFFLVWHFI